MDVTQDILGVMLCTMSWTFAMQWSLFTVGAEVGTEVGTAVGTVILVEDVILCIIRCMCIIGSRPITNLKWDLQSLGTSLVHSVLFFIPHDVACE